jgi:hypothetical protein
MMAILCWAAKNSLRGTGTLIKPRRTLIKPRHTLTKPRRTLLSHAAPYLKLLKFKLKFKNIYSLLPLYTRFLTSIPAEI